jgi:hypothetical protein
MSVGRRAVLHRESLPRQRCRGLAQALLMRRADEPIRVAKDAARRVEIPGVFELDGRRVVAAEYQPCAVYEVAMANVAANIERRPAPDTVGEVLTWARFALATAEVAELPGSTSQPPVQTRARGATFTASANLGCWATTSPARSGQRPSAAVGVLAVAGRHDSPRISSRDSSKASGPRAPRA